MRIEPTPSDEQGSSVDEQLKNLAGFLDMLVRIDLAHKEPDN